MDLVNPEAGLSALMSYVRPGGWLYLTLNFDGSTQFLPPLTPDLDAQIIALYHQSMDERRFHGLPTAEVPPDGRCLSLAPCWDWTSLRLAHRIGWSRPGAGNTNPGKPISCVVFSTLLKIVWASKH